MSRISWLSALCQPVRVGRQIIITGKYGAPVIAPWMRWLERPAGQNRAGLGIACPWCDRARTVPFIVLVSILRVVPSTLDGENGGGNFLLSFQKLTAAFA